MNMGDSDMGVDMGMTHMDTDPNMEMDMGGMMMQVKYAWRLAYWLALSTLSLDRRFKTHWCQ